MHFRLRDTPIRQKLTIAILLTCSVALVLMGSALITYELVTFRRSLATNIGVLAQIIATNSTASVAFQNRNDAQETLNALSAERQVSAAAIYDQGGRLFVRYPADATLDEFPLRAPENHAAFEGSHFVLTRPIEQDGQRLGTIYVRADLAEMYWRLMVYGILLLLVGLSAFLGAMFLARALQQRISLPILELAKVATAVSERQDYSVRGEKHGNDEIGQLTEAFNQMLTRIGESNAALAASEERLRLALEGSKTGTWDWDIVANRVTWDDYMYPLFGVTKDEFHPRQGAALESLVHPADRERVQATTRETVEQRRDLDVGFRILLKDGSVRYMASRGRVFYDDAGKPVRMAGVALDITESKQAEEALSRAKEAAEAANNAKDNFLAILSHELRTPLTPVLASVAMLENDETVPRHVARELEMIRRNIEVEARLIDDLLDVTGIVRGKFELNRQPVDVRSLLEHAMRSYCAAQAAKKHLRVSMEVTATETHILADSSRMTQVFWNLLQNACKFTPEGGAIAIRVYNEFAKTPAPQSGGGTELVVEISDTGVGISPENMARIFNAFEQGERSRTRRFGGLGLGLAISRAIVELHGGSIEAQSEGEGKGARITIRLQTAAAPPAPAFPRAAPSRPAAPAPQRRLRILLVEDHPDTAEQLMRLLVRAGHDVTWASSVREAQERVAAGAHEGPTSGFDILISDLGLPDGSGHDLMRHLANQHHIPGIALSGYGMKEDVDDSIAAGFARHMTKPVDWQELKSAIQKLAAENEPS